MKKIVASVLGLAALIGASGVSLCSFFFILDEVECPHELLK